FCHALTERFDRWLRELYGARTGVPEGVALVAVGGYGRRELCPFSDLDVLLVHEPKADVASLAPDLWYPIWDEGVKLGHATFTPKEALRLAASELDTATLLLSARHVAGDAAVTAGLAEAGRLQWVKESSRWLARLRDSLVLRSLNPGEVAFVLEPDLKLGRGGLRDAHTLRWLEVLEPQLLEADRAIYEAAYDRLLEARVALHLRTGRRGDALLLQEQDGVADDLGYEDADGLMAAVASSARTLEWLTDDAFDRVSLSGGRWRRRTRERRVGGGVAIRHNQVHLEDAVAEGAMGCVQLLDVARTAANQDLRVARATLERFAAADLRFPEPWPIEVRERFVELLRAGTPMISVVESLDHWGLWVRALPEWEPCRSRPQRNAYHRFTVDRHLCEAAANAAALASRVDRPDLLVVGALLHDIGKGYPPRDHTEVGVELLERMAPRLGFDEPDGEVLADLVRYHLLLPDVATRRDLSDDATISAVAAATRTESRLRLLAALTEADSIATGPAAWGDWKAGLVRELVDRTSLYLGGGDLGEVEGAFPTAAQRALVEAGTHLVRGEAGTLTVVARDRPGLFSRVAGVLALNALDVLAADAISDENGIALEVFTVQDSVGGGVNWEKVCSEIEAALAGRLAVRARLAERARVYRRRLVGPAPAPFERKVVMDNDASPRATVIEVRAPDAVGLLYRVTAAMAEIDVDISSAKIQTLGDHVVDAFYVRDSTGAKIWDEAHLGEIERALLHALGE
ncbi:MAG: [protein-PII] uridylyltransferase, partial [Acidimicrobiia bacterium]|nr:[protein-PII] uridylyltransferase [Acidimicrobiia bacterium]